MNYLVGYLIGYGYLFSIILLTGLAFKIFKFPSEISRKIIHITVCFTWIIMYKYFAGSIHSIIMPASFIVINALSFKFHIFKGMERDGENNSPGTIYYAIAITVLMTCALIWEETLIPSGVAIFCLSFGDGFAALFGKFLGKNSKKIVGNKTIIGTLACFVFSIIGIYILSIFVPLGLNFGEVAVLALACSALELFGHGLDNFSITIGVMLLCTLFLQT